MERETWIDDATGLPCIARKNKYGAWCGYVGVPPDHPWTKLGYDVPACVHGGVTYNEPCDGDPVNGVCHTGPDGRHWIGFDCMHSGDFVPGLSAYIGDVFRDLSYVKEQCANLARQAIGAGEQP